MPTILTRVLLEPDARTTMLAMANPDVMHRTIRAAYGDGVHPLWRIDSQRDLNVLYLVADREPGHALNLGGSLASRPYDPLLEGLDVGQAFGFRVRLNPIRSRPSPNPSTRGKKVPVLRTEEQLAWATEKLAQSGLEVSSIVSTARGTDVFKKEKGNQRIQLTWAQFDGIGIVADPFKLRDALVRGIGRGRAYGCGLLTLAKSK